MRTTFVAAAAVLVAGLVLLALPRRVEGQAPIVAQEDGAYEMEIVVRGTPRPALWLGGQRYVEGRLGERYAIRLHNHAWRRVEVVVAVDGRDAIDGGPAHAGKRGYVIRPHSTVEIDGFRLSLNDVAAFRFTTVPDSYAARMGSPWSAGHVSASFFPERVERFRYPLPMAGRAPAATAPRDSDRSAGERRSQNLGTEFGERRYSPVNETSFVRENPSWPTARVAIHYDDRRGLCRRGLDMFCDSPPDRRWDRPEEPRFSAPPPDWQE